MIDPNFWMAIEFEHMLVIQLDSVMCHGTIKAFLEYDYIGAPWKHRPENLDVGNGGFSLCCHSKMEWCANYKVPKSNFCLGCEDLYAKCVNDMGTLAPLTAVWQFSMEA